MYLTSVYCSRTARSLSTHEGSTVVRHTQTKVGPLPCKGDHYPISPIIAGGQPHAMLRFWTLSGQLSIHGHLDHTTFDLLSDHANLVWLFDVGSVATSSLFPLQDRRSWPDLPPPPNLPPLLDTVPLYRNPLLILKSWEGGSYNGGGRYLVRDISGCRQAQAST